MKLTVQERETVFSIAADNRKVLLVASNDPVWVRRLEKLGDPIKVEGETMWYEFSLNEFNFSLRKKRKMSEEQRRAMSKRMKRLRSANASNTGVSEG